MLRKNDNRSWIPVAAAPTPALDWEARRRAGRQPRYWQIGFNALPAPAPTWRVRTPGRD